MTAPTSLEGQATCFCVFCLHPLPASYRHSDNTSLLVLAAATDILYLTWGAHLTHSLPLILVQRLCIHPTAQAHCHHPCGESPYIPLCWDKLSESPTPTLHPHCHSAASTLHQQELWLKLRIALRIKTRIPGKLPQEPICHSPSITPLHTHQPLLVIRPANLVPAPRAFVHAVHPA